MLCTEYSRCSLAMKHTVRFFDILSSSLSRRLPNQAEYHRSSQSQIRGLSAKKDQGLLINFVASSLGSRRIDSTVLIILTMYDSNVGGIIINCEKLKVASRVVVLFHVAKFQLLLVDSCLYKFMLLQAQLKERNLDTHFLHSLNITMCTLLSILGIFLCILRILSLLHLQIFVRHQKQNLLSINYRI